MVSEWLNDNIEILRIIFLMLETTSFSTTVFTATYCLGTNTSYATKPLTWVCDFPWMSQGFRRKTHNFSPSLTHLNTSLSERENRERKPKREEIPRRKTQTKFSIFFSLLSLFCLLRFASTAFFSIFPEKNKKKVNQKREKFGENCFQSLPNVNGGRWIVLCLLTEQKSSSSGKLQSALCRREKRVFHWNEI